MPGIETSIVWSLREKEERTCSIRAVEVTGLLVEVGQRRYRWK